MKLKNIKNWLSYVDMILHIKKIKRELKKIKEMEKTIHSQERLIRTLRSAWHVLASNKENHPSLINAYKTLTYPSADLALLQNYLMYLLKSFDKICRENNLKYWMRGGSLIGVVRHENFIPWDDDIDIGMTRNDMFRLMEVLKDTDFTIEYYFNNSCKKDFCRMPRFINKNNGINIFIDIFPFDYTEHNEGESLKIYDEKRTALRNEVKSLIDKKQVKVYYGLMYDNYGSDAPILNKIFDKYIDKEQKITENLIYPFDWFDTTQNLYYKASNIFPLKEMKFRDLSVFVPNDYIFALNMCYNNFLDFPSKFDDHKDLHRLLTNKHHIQKFLLREGQFQPSEVVTLS